MPSHQLTPGLPAFPFDLLPLLAQTLHNDPSARPTLLALQRACLDGYRAVSPLLYREVRLETRGEWGSFFWGRGELERERAKAGARIIGGGVEVGVGAVVGEGALEGASISRGSGSANDHRFHTPSQRTLWAYRYVHTLTFVDLPFLHDPPHSPLVHLITRCSQHRDLFPHLRALHVEDQAFETCIALPVTPPRFRFRDEVLASGMHDILHALFSGISPPEIHVSLPPSPKGLTGEPIPGLARTPAERQNRFQQLVALCCKSATTGWRSPLLSVRVTTADEPAYRAELLPFVSRSRLQFAQPAVAAATLQEITPEEEKALGTTMRWLISALEFFLTLRSFRIERSKGAVVEICGIAGKGAGEDVVEEVKRMLLTVARETLLEHLRTWNWRMRDCAGLEETTISVYGQEYAPSMLGGQCIACGATTHSPTDDQPGGEGGIKLWAVRY
ncbi:hypothetical protein IAT38_007127 [Cryptococcus sp. DSM 104549]